MEGGIFNFQSPTQSQFESQSNDNTNSSSDTIMQIVAQSSLEKGEVNFVFKDEGYTLVNIVKEYLFDFPEIKFVGRRKHHKLDTEINLLIQLNMRYISENKPAEVILIDCLRRACNMAMNDALLLRNSIPDCPQREVDMDESIKDDEEPALQPNLFDNLFEPSDFKF